MLLNMKGRKCMKVREKEGWGCWFLGNRVVGKWATFPCPSPLPLSSLLKSSNRPCALPQLWGDEEAKADTVIRVHSAPGKPYIATFRQTRGKGIKRTDGVESANWVRLVKLYDIAFVSTGDVLRKEIAAKSAVGKEAEEIVKSGGQLLPHFFTTLIHSIIISSFYSFCKNWSQEKADL